VSGWEPIAAWRVPRLLVALDFDGTLAPLVDEPMAARMSQDARAAVEALARAGTTVALVSGRTLRDLRVIAEHDDDSPLLLAGSHGASSGRLRGGTGSWTLLLAQRDDLRARAEAIAADADRAWVEPKEFGFALHTRLVSDAAARAARRRGSLRSWPRRLPTGVVVTATTSSSTPSVRRARTARSRLRAQTGASAVLFAGDDVTDEDALRSLQPGDVGVRVGPVRPRRLFVSPASPNWRRC
jgi:trehalose 6-phosphate phosphatase